MTKQIRIENADTSNHLVQVYIEQKNEHGEWVRVNARALDLPTAMLAEYIHATQRLVIEEVK